MAEDDLHSSRQTLRTLLSPDYWRRVCPNLHVGDAEVQARLVKQQEQVADARSCATVRERLLQDGFAALPPSEVRWTVDVSKLAEAAASLSARGWPTTFLAMYDEAWVMAADASKVMQEATGNSLSMDIVGFLVDPPASRGFSPHRDRQPDDWVPRGLSPSVASTFRPDGMAKYVTLWAALTDANPDNSCLHFVPKDCDPGYLEGDSDDADPMQRCFPDKDAYRRICCAPVAAGGCTFHTHRTIHWGGAGRASCGGEARLAPRIALSFGFSDPAFEPPYLSPKCLPFPDVKLRLALVSAQVLNYATLSAGDAGGWTALAGPSLAGCSAGTLGLLRRLYQRQEKAFHATYRKEIARKFVRAALSAEGAPALAGAGGAAAAAGAAPAGACAGAPVGSAGAALPASAGARGHPAASAAAADRGGASSEEEEALEAMLQAEAVHGEVLFHDDFDMLNASGPAGAGAPAAKGGRGARPKRKGKAARASSAEAQVAIQPRRKRKRGS